MVNVKESSYTALYPILRIAESALHVMSLTDLFNLKPSQLIWEASSHMLQLSVKATHTHHVYSFIQLNKLEQYRVKKLARIRTRVFLVESPKLYL